MTKVRLVSALQGFYIYVRFAYQNYGYAVGDIVRAVVIQRDDYAVQVHLHDNSPGNLGALITAWSDLGSFQELNEMEVIAYAASGKAFL